MILLLLLFLCIVVGGYFAYTKYSQHKSTGSLATPPASPASPTPPTPPASPTPSIPPPAPPAPPTPSAPPTPPTPSAYSLFGNYNNLAFNLESTNAQNNRTYCLLDGVFGCLDNIDHLPSGGIPSHIYDNVNKTLLTHSGTKVCYTNDEKIISCETGTSNGDTKYKFDIEQIENKNIRIKSLNTNKYCRNDSKCRLQETKNGNVNVCQPAIKCDADVGDTYKIVTPYGIKRGTGYVNAISRVANASSENSWLRNCMNSCNEWSECAGVQNRGGVACNLIAHMVQGRPGMKILDGQDNTVAYVRLKDDMTDFAPPQ